MENKKFQQDHINDILVDNLIEFKNEAYMSMASISGKTGSFSIGVDALGNYAIKTKDKMLRFTQPKDAIDKYSELVLGN